MHSVLNKENFKLWCGFTLSKFLLNKLCYNKAVDSLKRFHVFTFQSYLNGKGSKRRLLALIMVLNTLANSIKLHDFFRNLRGNNLM